MNRAKNEPDGGVKSFILSKLSVYWKEDPSIFDFLCEQAVLDSNEISKVKRPNPRKASLEALLAHYPTHPKYLELLNDRALNDSDDELRQWAQAQQQKLEVNP